MSISKTQLTLVLPALLLALLGGCAITDQTQEQKKSIETGVAEANTAQAAGQSDQAVSVLKAVATRFPADKTPWIRMAQIKFDAGSYGEAIVNAQEALQRDPTDQVANSIVAVSGLRVSTKALADLRTQNALSGTVKSESQDLTRILRESLGEAVLVPGGAKPVAAAAPTRRAPRGRTRAGAATNAVAAPASNAAAPLAAPAASAPPSAPAAAAPDKGHSNPFGGLK